MKNLFLALTLISSLSAHASLADLADLFSSADKKYDELEKKEKLSKAIQNANIMLVAAKLDKEFEINIIDNKDAISKKFIYATNGHGGICQIGTVIQQVQQQQQQYNYPRKGSKIRDLRLTSASKLSIKCLNQDGSLIIKN